MSLIHLSQEAVQ